MNWRRRRKSPPTVDIQSARLARAPHVHTVTQGDETVLLDAERGQYYTLNEVGGRIWSLLVDGTSFAEIVDRLCAEYDVTRERGERDADMLLRELLGKSLLRAERRDS
ncbi:MAG TPA: PqqD family protein [Gemmatimonadaceae bacterium]|nr:PqqD family protein [Gemmatimonadaceae bacterium]